MKISEFVSQVNTKKNVKPSRLLNLKKYYISMYRAYMVYLYDRGFIDDPTVFNKKLIYRNILELKVKGMQDITGTIVLTSKQASYALCKNQGDEDASEFLKLLAKALYYRESCASLDRLYEEFDIGGADRKKVCLQMKRAGARIYSKLDFKITSGLLNCLLQDGSHAKSTSLHEEYWDLAMDILGVPKEDWYSDGLFDSALSHSQEVEFMDILLDGVVPLDGKYSEMLLKWLYQHKWAEKGMTNQLQGLYSLIYIVRSDEVMAIQSKYLNALVADEKTIVGMSSDEIFYEDKIQTYNIPMSCFSVIGGDSDECTFEGNILNGYTGECYPPEYLREEGMNYIGCPIELNVSARKKSLFYDYEQLDLSFNTWFKDNEASLYFPSEEEVRSKLSNPFQLGTLEREIYNIYLKSLSGNLIGSIDGKYDYSEIEAAKKNIMKILKN